jgi:hypothetical protein
MGMPMIRLAIMDMVETLRVVEMAEYVSSSPETSRTIPLINPSKM